MLSGGASNESTSKLSSSMSCSSGPSVVELSPNTDWSWSFKISSLVIDGHDVKLLMPKIEN